MEASGGMHGFVLISEGGESIEIDDLSDSSVEDTANGRKEQKSCSKIGPNASVDVNDKESGRQEGKMAAQPSGKIPVSTAQEQELGCFSAVDLQKSDPGEKIEEFPCEKPHQSTIRSCGAQEADAQLIRENKNTNGEPHISVKTMHEEPSDGTESLTTLKDARRFFCDNNIQFIEKKNPLPMKIEQLGYAAFLKSNALETVLSNEGCLIIADNNFVAKVEIVQPQLLDESCSFDQAKEVLLKQLRVVKVVLDDMKQKRAELRTHFYRTVEQVMAGAEVDDCITLFQIIEDLQRCHKINYQDLCAAISRESLQSAELRESALDLLAIEQSVLKRNEDFGILEDSGSLELGNNLIRLRAHSATNYRNILLQKAPEYLHELLNSVCDRRIAFISIDDITLFKDMTSTLDGNMFRKPLEDLAKRWIRKTKAASIDDLKEIGSPKSHIYLYLCKSLQELIIAISTKSNSSATELLMSDEHDWNASSKIKWEAESPSNISLEREYYFIFKLLKHFELNPGVRRERLVYSTKWCSVTLENSTAIPEEFYVWYCLMNDVLGHILPQECNISIFDEILQLPIKLIGEAGNEQLEKVRVITHSTIRLIVQTIPYLKTDNQSIDRQVLRKQLDMINSTGIEDLTSFEELREMVDVFNSYWSNRNDIIEPFSSKIDLPEMAHLQAKLLQIVKLALDKQVPAEAVVEFVRVFNDFIVDLNGVQFDWIIKKISTDGEQMKALSALKMIEPVSNKLVGQGNESFRVKEPQLFSQWFRINYPDSAVPKHYVTVIVTTLLSFIHNQLEKVQWGPEDSLTATDQITSTHQLISAVKSTLLYLNEQADYASFELFFEERIKPFSSVIYNSTSLQDFINMLVLIKVSFGCIRKQNEMNVDESLDAPRAINSGCVVEKSRNQPNLGGNIGYIVAERPFEDQNLFELDETGRSYDTEGSFENNGPFDADDQYYEAEWSNDNEGPYETRWHDETEVPFDDDENSFDGDEVPYDADGWPRCEVPFGKTQVPYDEDEIPFDGNEVPYDADEAPLDGTGWSNEGEGPFEIGWAEQTEASCDKSGWQNEIEGHVEPKGTDDVTDGPFEIGWHEQTEVSYDDNDGPGWLNETEDVYENHWSCETEWSCEVDTPYENEWSYGYEATECYY